MNRLDTIRAIRSVLALAVLVLLSLVPRIVLASQGQTTALGRLTDEVMAILLPTFVTAVGLLASWLLWKLRQKLAVSVSAETERQWTELAKKAALRGAEWARKELKARADQTKLPGEKILAVAVDWAIEAAHAMGLPAKARAALEGLIESQLFQLRREDNERLGLGTADASRI